MSPRDALARADVRLNAAEFFLQKLTNAERNTVRLDVAFPNYLLAFLAAARSGHTYLEKRGKRGWYDQWKDAIDASDPANGNLLEFMRDQRDEELHGCGTQMRVARKRIRADLVRGVTVIGLPIALLAEEAKRAGKPFHPEDFTAWIELPEFFYDDQSPQRVVDKCRRYLQLLRQLRGDFATAHGL